MPELPEVEVTRRGLLPHLPGHRITTVGWSNKRLRLPIPRSELQLSIKGQIVEAIDRRGKYLLFRMASGSVLVFHLGMTGKIGVFPCRSPHAKHDHLRLLLDNGMEMRFNDSRRFGSVSVWPTNQAEEMEHSFSANIGIEPFSDAFTADHLAAIAHNRRLPVKSFLMNSRIIAGFGNIYANETLFAAGIHPQTMVQQLTMEDWQKIVRYGIDMLERAIAAGGSTISDFIGSSGQPGYFQVHFRVYKKQGNECSECGTPIEKEVLAGRATYFCPTCQKKS